jgi:Leucine Rich repeat
LTHATNDAKTTYSTHIFTRVRTVQALAELLPHCPHLTDLRFSGTRAGREGSVAVAKALSESPAAAAGNFTSLDLADNTFGSEGGALLASMLSKQVCVYRFCF